ncbi:hypothetical protein V1273_000118 [Bradyrhizobium sp. AZCC 1721]
MVGTAQSTFVPHYEIPPVDKARDVIMNRGKTRLPCVFP